MFDLTSGKLLLLGIVALIVLGPKDFPILLRTIGKYMGIIKRQADEFRDQFNDAIRESEFDQIKKEVEGLGQEAEASMRATEQSISKDLDSARTSLDVNLDDPLKLEPQASGYTPAALSEPAPTWEQDTTTPPVTPDPDAHDANGIPMVKVEAAKPDHASLNGSGTHPVQASPTAETTPKSGA